MQSIEKNIGGVFASEFPLELLIFLHLELPHANIIKYGPPVVSNQSIEEIMPCWDIGSSVADESHKAIFPNCSHYWFVP